MIFKPELVRLILQGKKTQTRRPVKSGEEACRYKVNHAYSVQPGRGQAGVEKITIVSEPRRERLGDITPKDAQREGFRNTREFFEYWSNLYGSVDLDQEVWVISFIKGDHVDMDRFLAQGSPSQTCNATLPNGRRCGRAFSDDPPDKPQTVCKCGARRPQERMDDKGYTQLGYRRLKGELPAIPESLQKQYSDDAREKPRETREQELVAQRSHILESIRKLREHELDRDTENRLRVIERQAFGLAPRARAA